MSLRNHVAVMEGEEGSAEKGEHLEGDVGFKLGGFHRFAEPRPLECRRAEHIDALPSKIVPVADRRAQMLRHRLSQYFASGLVVSERQRIVALCAFKSDRLDIAEEARRHIFPPSSAGETAPPCSFGPDHHSAARATRQRCARAAFARPMLRAK